MGPKHRSQVRTRHVFIGSSKDLHQEHVPGEVTHTGCWVLTHLGQVCPDKQETTETLGLSIFSSHLHILQTHDFPFLTEFIAVCAPSISFSLSENCRINLAEAITESGSAFLFWINFEAAMIRNCFSILFRSFEMVELLSKEFCFDCWTLKCHHKAWRQVSGIWSPLSLTKHLK